jgi:serine/threonine protein kinase
MKAKSGGSADEPGKEPRLMQQEARTCPLCGTKYFAAADGGFCPVCILHGAAGGESAASGEPSSVSGAIDSPADTEGTSQVRWFEHYEVMLDENGRPIELDRGAMGVTYKALDVNLRRPVTLKVISERYLGDESARLRFLREARAAASVRHPNVASVFHLGRTGKKYFYAMEFVEGETLEHLIKRSGHIDARLALEIVSQVAAGLATVHKQKLVHRDIKPSNIMVNLQERSAVTAKIIDLGLAKAVDESGPQTVISTPGAFVGTPEFASPEQFAGVDVDIRSDLYSLGVTLWVMLIGKAPFGGTPAEVMYQHQHRRLPLEQLKLVPLPVVTLLKTLLEKDPSKRPRTPADLLKSIPRIASAIDSGRKITLKSLQSERSAASRVETRRLSAKRGPKKISLARLPITGSNVFGREEDIAFLDAAWANHQINIVSIIAWAGVGKSTLVNHWLAGTAIEHYRSAEVVFGWSFYRQGSRGGTSSADEFLDAALTWFGDPDSRIGTAWEKGERLANLIAHRRTLLILDGLEPLQNPPGTQEGRLREPSLQALLRELAAFNKGLCVITTRLPVADIADRDGTSVLHRELKQLSNDAGARLLEALGVKGQVSELRNASDEFGGHCLALTLLGSYLTDVYRGDIRCRQDVSARLAEDVRQGGHARKVMESYQTWFGEGPELSVLRILGLFDRPVDDEAFEAVLKPPAIRGLTESLTKLDPTEWGKILAKLRRARLLAGEDPHSPGHLDTHPLVREYFGEQLRNQWPSAWKKCSRRLYNHYRGLAPQLPDCFRDMEPLFQAAICGCNAGLYREALHEVYIPRIQRGKASFAANVLGARGALLSVLAHFFEKGHWGSPVETRAERHSLTTGDKLFLLMQAGLLLTATRGVGTPEARICYERAEAFCHSLNHPVHLYAALMGQLRHSSATDKLTTTLGLAERVHTLAQQQKEPALLLGAYRALASTLHFLGDFKSAQRYAMLGVQIWRSGSVPHRVEEVTAPAVACLYNEALAEWHLGETASCHANMAEAISLAKQSNDTHGLVAALSFAAFLAYCDYVPAEVERLASEVIETSAHHNFALWVARAKVLRGWARSASGNIEEGVSWIKDGIEEVKALGTSLMVPYMLALKAEALHLTDRTLEALEMIKEAESLIERSEERWLSAELHRLRGVFLRAIGADATQIEASFCKAITTAKAQRSISFARRAEAAYADYRREKS